MSYFSIENNYFVFGLVWPSLILAEVTFWPNLILAEPNFGRINIQSFFTKRNDQKYEQILNLFL